MSFRYDIGFLRALAVIVVVLFHYQVPFFNGGFVGVDIFFVISGFLMTSIVLNKIKSDSFLLGQFYMKRFVRIVPALIVMMLGVLIVTFFLYFPIDYRELSSYSFYSGVFLSNYYYLFNSGYFSPSSQSNILLHTWSLSVEWQFYMIYPLLLMFLKKIYLKSRNKFNIIFLGTALMSFLLVIIFNNFFPTSYNKISFFSFTHRAWEMMLGGVAYLYSNFFLKKISNPNKKLISILCYICLLLSIVCFDHHDVWPSCLTLVPVIATFLLIAINREYKIYKNKIIQYIGSISYSWYLWHWPIYVIASYFVYRGWMVVTSIFIFSLILSVFSYEFVEKKINLKTKKQLFIVTCLIIVFSGFSSFLPLNNQLFTKEIVEITEFNSKYEQTRQKQFHSGVCHNIRNINYKECMCIDSYKKNILLLGDSHAGQFSLSFRTKLDTTQYNFMEHTVVGSFPLVNANGSKESTNQFKKIFKELKAGFYSNIDVVVLSCNWVNYVSSGGYNSDVELADDILETIEYIEKLNIKLIILGQSENYYVDYPKVEAFKKMYNTKKTYIKENSISLNNNLKRLLSSENYVDLFLRQEFQHYDEINRIPYKFDDDHFSLYGANQIVDFLISNNYLVN